MCWAGGQIFDSNNWNLLIKGGLGQGCSPSWKGRSTKVKRLPESEHSRDLEDSPEVEPSTDTKFPVPALPPRLADPANLSNPTRDSRSIKYRMEPVTFKGTYGGHAYELNGTITVRNSFLHHVFGSFGLTSE
jgi:hypothetical protein